MVIRSIIKTVALWSLSLVSTAAAAQQFNQPLVIPTGGWPAGIVAADLNGDGKADLIYTDYGATATASMTHVLLGKTERTFAQGQTIAAGWELYDSGDWDFGGECGDDESSNDCDGGVVVRERRWNGKSRFLRCAAE
jgi:hypothetical protein